MIVGEYGTYLKVKDVDWNNLREAQQAITFWAEMTFPDRVPEASLSKLVLEEIPELLHHKKTQGVKGIDGELADCFILLMDLATLWGVDLPTAIEKKMDVNSGRLWRKDEATGFYNHMEDVPHDASR